MRKENNENRSSSARQINLMRSKSLVARALGKASLLHDAQHGRTELGGGVGDHHPGGLEGRDLGTGIALERPEGAGRWVCG